MKPFSSADLVNQVTARLEAAERDRTLPADEELQARRNLALADLGTALGAACSVGQALEALLASPLCSLGATAAGIGLLDQTRHLLRITYSGDMRPEAADRYHLVDKTTRCRWPRWCAPTSAWQCRTPPGLIRAITKLSPPNVRASVMEPLHAEDGSVLGAMALHWPTPRQFSPADVEVIERAAAVLSRTVARIAVAEREHQIAMALQERLLELGARSTAAVVSAAYQPAGETVRVGGDWYTATPLGEKRLGISVGDVVGHGLPAAAVMSQLRSALHHRRPRPQRPQQTPARLCERRPR